MGQATCDWLSVLHSPALQPILLAGVVLDVEIEVEVRAHGVAQPEGQNYGAGYLFLSVESFASWRLERSGREILN